MSGYSPAARFAALLLMAGLASAGCSRPAAPATEAPAAPAEKRYPLRAEIIATKPEEGIIVAHHEEIPNYMPEMTMEFRVSKADARNAKPGQRIRGEMYEKNGEAYLEKIWPDDTAVTGQLDAAVKALAQDTAIRGKEVYREVGEAAPEFTLLDQEGRPVVMSRFRGRKVMLNFIFTRCPIATMCPASTQRMSDLQQAAKAAGVTGLEFVSITLDPEYDTPGVLKEYAEVRGLDTSNWSFLTGPDAAVRHLLAQLGVIREFTGNTINHTLATLLINEQGRIIHRVDGSRWDNQEFLPKIQR